MVLPLWSAILQGEFSEGANPDRDVGPPHPGLCHTPYQYDWVGGAVGRPGMWASRVSRMACRMASRSSAPREVTVFAAVHSVVIGIAIAAMNVRFWGNNGHRNLIAPCLLLTRSGPQSLHDTRKRLLRFFRIDIVASKLRSSGEYQLGYDPRPLTREVTVRIMTLGTALLTATALALSASAQTTPTAPAITRTIVAATKLPSVVETRIPF